MTLKNLLTLFIKDAQILQLKLMSKEITVEEKNIEEEDLIDDLLEKVKEEMIG